MIQIRHLWNTLRSSLWFTPSILVLASLALAVLLIEAESWVAREDLVRRWPRLFGAGAEGAREMLGAIAGSMITVAGVTFSITIVSFALASNQYTSRILRTFMRDQGNQTVLGVFVGIFAYCLVVLRTVRGGDDEHAFVPSLAVLGAVLLALLGIGFLVYFIHHISDSIQASSVIRAVAGETTNAVDRLFPDESDGPEDEPDPRQRSGEGRWIPVSARKTGYVQAIDFDGLVKIARSRKATIRMEYGIGEFVIEDTPLLYVRGVEPDKTLAKPLNDAFNIGRHRTVHQDVAYGIRQIVDIALKALSPAMNDTTTALICVDFLGSVLVRLGSRRVVTRDCVENGELLLITRGPTFTGLLAQAFDEIREAAEGKFAVLERLIHTLAVIGAEVRGGERRDAVREQGRLAAEVAERTVPSAYDRATIAKALNRLSGALDGKQPAGES